VIIKSLVGISDQLAVKPLLAAARLVATDQKYGPSLWIEGKSYAPYCVRGFKPQFFHVRVTGAL
jgi:hypothetical protein